MIIILIFYAVKAVIEDVIRVRIYDTKERYTFRKVVSIIITFLTLASLFAVWFKETTGLIVAYGILSAGIAIALQDLLKSIAGGIIIFVSRPFRAGDRIEVDNIIGDVLDIRNFSTSLMEIREWVDGDQYTGRLVQVPNSFILSGKVKNYTKDFSFIWDEVQIMLVYGSNWKKAKDIALKVAKETLYGFEESAKKELLNMGEKYFITTYDVETRLYMKMQENWIDIRIRYVVDPRQRRKIRNNLVQNLLEAYDQEEDINVGTATSLDLMK
ncbi:MAG: mechanosensitive ion channel family protein [Halobacteriota archaeon]